MMGSECRKDDRDVHARLVRGMVRRVGVDLGDRAADSRVTDESLGTILDRCCQCRFAGSCQAWQLDHCGGAEVAPPYCLNRDLFTDMSRRS